MSSALPLPQAAAAPEAMVRATRPDGTRVQIPQSSVDLALQRGYELDTPEQIQAAALESQYGGTGGELTAAALGAARGLTFGGSDLALRATGIASPETLKGYEEANPVASAVGEYGAIGATLLPGAAARVAGTGIRGVSLLGHLVGDAIAGETTALGARAAAGGLATQLAVGAVRAGTTGAVEGAVYGLGGGLSEAAMTDEKDLGPPAEVAQMLWAHATGGAVFGGALGAGLGGSAVLGKAASRRVFRALATDAGPGLAEAAADGSAPPPAAPSPGEVPPVASGPSVGPPPPDAAGIFDRFRDTTLDTLGRGAAAVTSLTSGVEEKEAQRLFAPGEEGRRTREVAFDGDAIVTDQTRKLTSLVTDIAADNHAVTEATLGAFKSRVIEKSIRPGLASTQVDAAMGMVNKVQQFIEEARDPQYAGAAEGSLRRLEKAVVAARVKMLRLGEVEEASTSDAAKAYMTIDNLKRAVGKAARPGVLLSADEKAVIEPLRRDLYNGTLQKFLEDTDLWGEAAERQAAHNQRWVGKLDKLGLFEQQYLTAFGRDGEQASWLTKQVGAPDKVNSLVADAGNVRNDLRVKVLLDQLDADAAFAKSALDNYDLTGETAAAAKRQIARVAEAKKVVAQALDDAAIRNLGREVMNTKTGRALSLLAQMDKRAASSRIVRSDLAAELRAAAAKMTDAEERAATEKLADQADAAHAAEVKKQELSGVAKALKATVGALRSAADATVTGARAAKPLALRAGADATYYGLSGDDEGPRTPEARLMRAADRVAAYSAQPQRLADDLQQATAGLATVAPETAAMANAVKARGVSYLAANVPKPPGYALTPGQRKAWRPSPRETASFGARLRAVMDPMTVAHDLADGSLRPEGVDALAQVYPSVHDALLGMVYARMARTEDVPFAVRQRVSYLFGQPTDGMTDPALGTFIAQAGGATGAPPDTGTGSFTPTDRTALKNSTATAAQRIGGI